MAVAVADHGCSIAFQNLAENKTCMLLCPDPSHFQRVWPCETTSDPHSHNVMYKLTWLGLYLHSWLVNGFGLLICNNNEKQYSSPCLSIHALPLHAIQMTAYCSGSLESGPRKCVFWPFSEKTQRVQMYL